MLMGVGRYQEEEEEEEAVIVAEGEVFIYDETTFAAV